MDIGKRYDRKFEEVLNHMPFWLKIWPFLVFALAMLISFVGDLFDFDLANVVALSLCVVIFVLMRVNYTLGFAAALLMLLVYGFRFFSYGGIVLGNTRYERWESIQFTIFIKVNYDIFLLALAVLLVVMNLSEFKRVLTKIVE